MSGNRLGGKIAQNPTSEKQLSYYYWGYSIINLMVNDTNILEALKNGSKEAFEAIYKQYAGKLYHFIITLSHGNQYMAEKILQATFVKLWEIHPQVNPQKSILFYLSSIETYRQT